MKTQKSILDLVQTSMKAGFITGFVVAIIATGISININFLWNNFHDFIVFFLFALAIKVPVWCFFGLMLGILMYLLVRVSNWSFLLKNMNRIIFLVIFNAAFFFYSFLNMMSTTTATFISKGQLLLVLIIFYLIFLGFALPLILRFVSTDYTIRSRLIITTVFFVSFSLISAMWIVNRSYSTEGIRLVVEDRHTNVKLLLFGVDAAGWDMISPLVAAGKLPNIERLMKKGVSGDLKTIKPVSSPVIWTTIATGKSFKKHGASSFIKHRLAHSYYSVSIPPGFGMGTVLGILNKYTGRKLSERIVISGRSVKTSLLWEILSKAGKSVAVFGWWCTYPAKPVNGYLVSDYYDEMLLEENEDANFYDTTYPYDLAEQLRPDINNLEGQVRIGLKRFINMGQEEIDYVLSTPDHPQHEAFSQMKHVYFEDLIQKQAASFVLRNSSPDLLILYFRGVDIAGHYYWKYCHLSDYSYEISQNEINAYKNTIENYYGFVDESIGEIIALTHENYAIIVLSDHRMSHVNPDNPEALRSGGHFEPIPGIILCNGIPFRSNTEIEGSSVYDITPTILQVFGFPQARDFDGHILTESLEREFCSPIAKPPIESYDSKITRPEEGEKSPIDEEIKSRLRGLGYIE